MKNNAKVEFFGKIIGQIWVIAAVMSAFFLSAGLCELFPEWDAQFSRVVVIGIKSSVGALFVATLLWLPTFFVKGGFKSINVTDWICAGFIMTFHYVIRLQMIGTIQLSDGLEYYMNLNNLVHNPQMLVDNFIEGGKLCGHFAHGYAFMCMIGEFIMPGSSYGFQWASMFMGIAASGCLYTIFKKLLPNRKCLVPFLAAFVVSLQPMFVGLSTMCNLEFAITVFTIYVIYCYVKKQYILMFFWLAFLGTSKETGTFVALVILALFVIKLLADFVKKGRLGTKKQRIFGCIAGGFVLIILMMPLLNWILHLEVWGGKKLIEMIGVGGDGLRTFAFSAEHIKMKLAQLFVLNFSWIWVVLVVACAIAVAFIRIKKGKNIIKKPAKGFLMILFIYAAYTLFLLFYLEAKQPRYNMLSDVLFSLISVWFLANVIIPRYLYIPVMTIMIVLMGVESFVTVDPVSTSLFTNVETNGMPMVFTLTFKDDMEVMNSNAGDFAYYNYHYTVVDRAIDKALAEYSWGGLSMVLSASIETQFFYDYYRWDRKELRRGFDVYGDQERYFYIRYRSAFDTYYGTEWPDTAILIESPWSRGDLEGALYLFGQNYRIEGPYEAKEGIAGSIIYYLLWRE